MSRESPQWTEYVGICGTTNEDGVTPVIDAHVPEFLPNVKTCCLTKKWEEKACIKDPFTGATKCATLMRSHSVKCVYLGGSNTSIPCTVIGERVRILNIGGTEQYYWLPYGRDPGLHRHERMRWFVMSQPTAVSGGTYPDVEDTNSYFLEFNSNKGQKEFHIHTSIKDGEPFQYDIHILPEMSTILITDNIGNYIKLKSDDHQIIAHNNDDSYIDINKENITLNCKDTITLNAGKQIIENAGVAHKTTSPDITRSGEKTITDNASTVGITGDTVNITGSSGDCYIGKISLTKHPHPVPPHCPFPGNTNPPTPT